MTPNNVKIGICSRATSLYLVLWGKLSLVLGGRAVSWGRITQWVRLTLFWVSSAWHKCSSLPGDCCALFPHVIAVLVSQCFGISWHFSKLCFHLCSIALLFICRRMLVFFVCLFYLHNVFKFFGYLGMGIVDIGRVVEKLLCSDARKAPGMGTGFGCPS